MRTLYPEGHDIFASGLTYSEDAREFEDRQRTLAFVGDLYGVVSGLDVTDASIAGNCRIQVSPGLAIDAQGYRVVLDSATTVSGLTGADIGSQVTIQRSNVDIFPTAHPITGASAYTREVDGASVMVSGGYASGLGHVLLACISSIVTGGAPEVSFSTTLRNCREELRIDPQRLGTGRDVNEHRLSAHDDGISGDTGSLIASKIDDTIDYITFTPLGSNSWISINGVLLSPNDVNPVANVYFSGSDATGYWDIYINSSGVTGKTQSGETGQFLLATLYYDSSGDITELIDQRVFYETRQNHIRVDLEENQTNDSLTEVSTLQNNLNRMRYRLNLLETTAGGAYPVIGNTNADYNGTTDAIFTTAIAALPASGGTLTIADGTWIFGSAVNVDRPVHFFGAGHSHLCINSTSPATFFDVFSSGVTFEGIDFSISIVSGGPYYVINATDQIDLTVRDCQLFAESQAATFVGDFVRVAGGSNIRVEGNYFYSDTANSIHLTEVRSGANATSGLSITNNITEGKGNALLFTLNTSASAQDVTIANNIGNIGTYCLGDRTWISSSLLATTMYNALIVGNSFHSYATGAPGGYSHSFCSFGHIGGVAVIGNVAKFNLPATTTPTAISVFSEESVIQGNIIHDVNQGIYSTGDKCVIYGNGLYGVTNAGIYVGGTSYSSVVGNMIYGSGASRGVYLSAASSYNLVASNNIKGFTNGIYDAGGTSNLVSGTNWNQVNV